AAHREEPRLLRLVSSASAMWAANAATVAPASDTRDGRTHLVPANLKHMFHRSLEARTTRDVLRAIFQDEARFVVHEPLPGGDHFADEGAANHTRLCMPGGEAVHLFAWGREAFAAQRSKQPARQTLEASRAVARLLQLDPSRTVFAEQAAAGIAAGAFHTDVVAVGNQSFFMAHELAFTDGRAVERDLRALLGSGFHLTWVDDRDLPIADAVRAYPFNSQIISLPATDPPEMVIVAPVESRDTPTARRFLDRVVAEENPVRRVVYLDVRESMKNGGGPACLRQRVPLSEADIARLSGRVVFDADLERELVEWVGRHYRDRLVPADLADPALHREGMEALDELTRMLELGSVYEFQR
ncbi:MAG: N-succinylarginine dihydrolase, partial [Myxococcales bacterium]|nr:N-succinylarginine dihydrolase [Myxococcales bacterium]